MFGKSRAEEVVRFGFVRKSGKVGRLVRIVRVERVVVEWDGRDDGQEIGREDDGN